MKTKLIEHLKSVAVLLYLPIYMIGYLIYVISKLLKALGYLLMLRKHSAK